MNGREHSLLLERITRLEAQVNALADALADHARAEAEAAERAQRQELRDWVNAQRHPWLRRAA
jgi:hypothetical protein